MYLGSAKGCAARPIRGCSDLVKYSKIVKGWGLRNLLLLVHLHLYLRGVVQTYCERDPDREVADI